MSRCLRTAGGLWRRWCCLGPCSNSVDIALAKLEKEFATEDRTRPAACCGLCDPPPPMKTRPDATFGGIYRTGVWGVARLDRSGDPRLLGLASGQPLPFTYRERVPKPRVRSPPWRSSCSRPRSRAAGVAYSRHPISGRADQVMINAVFGLAEPLVSGLVRPDQYIVEIGSDPAFPEGDPA